MSAAGGGSIILSASPRVLTHSGKTLTVSTTGGEITISQAQADALVNAVFAGLSGVTVASMVYDPD